MKALGIILLLGGLGALAYAAWHAVRIRLGGHLPEGARTPRQIAVLGAVAFVVGLVMVPADDEPEDRAGNGTEMTQTATDEATDPDEAADPDAVLARASQAVDQDDYDEALAIARQLDIDDRRKVRRAISARLASRARSALRRGDRGTARSLLGQVAPFPKTEGVRRARASLTAAEDRARQRKLAAEQRAAERRAQERAEQEAQEQQEQEEEREQSASCEAGYDPCVPTYPPDLDCGDLGGPYTVSGSDPHGLDADGDGVGCE